MSTKSTPGERRFWTDRGLRGKVRGGHPKNGASFRWSKRESSWFLPDGVDWGMLKGTLKSIAISVCPVYCNAVLGLLKTAVIYFFHRFLGSSVNTISIVALWSCSMLHRLHKGCCLFEHRFIRTSTAAGWKAKPMSWTYTPRLDRQSRVWWGQHFMHLLDRRVGHTKHWQQQRFFELNLFQLLLLQMFSLPTAGGRQNIWMFI